MSLDDFKLLGEFERIRSKYRLPEEIKPCIVGLFENPDIRRGSTAFLVACELHRVGVSRERARSLFERFMVPEGKIRGVIKSGFSGKYRFRCQGLEAEGICLYERPEECHWYGGPVRQGQKIREKDFWRYEWPKRLSPAEVVIYLGIQEIERKRRFQAGAWLFVSRVELAEVAGVSLPWVLECCQRLKGKGLIKFKKGKQGRWFKTASEIQRVVPIPKGK